MAVINAGKAHSSLAMKEEFTNDSSLAASPNSVAKINFLIGYSAVT